MTRSGSRSSATTACRLRGRAITAKKRRARSIWRFASWSRTPSREATRILKARRADLDQGAEILLERETITSAELPMLRRQQLAA